MRIWLYNRSVKDTTIAEEAKEVKDSVVGAAKGMVNDPEGTAKKAGGINVK